MIALKSMGIQKDKLRLLYRGREMKEGKKLGNYGYEEGTIIQAIIV